MLMMLTVVSHRLLVNEIKVQIQGCRPVFCAVSHTAGFWHLENQYATAFCAHLRTCNQTIPSFPTETAKLSSSVVEPGEIDAFVGRLLLPSGSMNTVRELDIPNRVGIRYIDPPMGTKL